MRFLPVSSSIPLVSCQVPRLRHPGATSPWEKAPDSVRRSHSTARINLTWGLHHCCQGQFEKALKCFERAHQQYRQAQDPVGIGRCLNGLSAVYLQTQDPVRAVSCSQMAMAVLAKTSACSEQALALYQLGVSHLKLDQLSQAQQALEQALAAYTALQDALNEDRVLLHLGQLYGRRRQFMFALACYEAVLDNMLRQPLSEAVQDLLFKVIGLMIQLCEETRTADRPALYQYLFSRYCGDRPSSECADRPTREPEQLRYRLFLAWTLHQLIEQRG